jgi:hypothetical protein
MRFLDPSNSKSFDQIIQLVPTTDDIADQRCCLNKCWKKSNRGELLRDSLTPCAAVVLILQPAALEHRCFGSCARVTFTACNLASIRYKVSHKLLDQVTFPNVSHPDPNATATYALRHSQNSFIIPVMFVPMILVFVMCEMISIGVGRCCLAKCTRNGTNREAVKSSSDVGESGTYTNQLLSLILVPSYPSYLSDDSAISQPPPSYQHDLPPSYSQKSNLEMVWIRRLTVIQFCHKNGAGMLCFQDRKSKF